MQNSIITTFIKQDLADKSLFSNALSQIVVKCIYEFNGIENDNIYKKINDIIGYTLEENKINDSLDELIKKRRVQINNGRYSIVNEYKSTIDSYMHVRNFRFDKAIGTYFNQTDLNIKDVKDVFHDMNIEFFIEYNNNWLEDFIGRSGQKKSYLSEFNILKLRHIFKKYKISETHSKWLFDQFMSYLRTNDPEIELLMLDVSYNRIW